LGPGSPSVDTDVLRGVGNTVWVLLIVGPVARFWILVPWSRNDDACGSGCLEIVSDASVDILVLVLGPRRIGSK